LGVHVHLGRWLPPAAEGWWSMDLHTHLHYGPTSADRPYAQVGGADAARMMRGEGLNVLNLLCGNILNAADVYDTSLFTGAPVAVDDRTTHAEEAEMRSSLLGLLELSNLTGLILPPFDAVDGSANPYLLP